MRPGGINGGSLSGKSRAAESSPLSSDFAVTILPEG